MINMQNTPTIEHPEARFFVMNRSEDHWIRLSKEYSSRMDAEKALEKLRLIYPFARLGGSRTN
ncbi:MAG: hypothetical protein LJE91_00265 [Gammaproteobacteria bacterium]|jgi:hypothetical protein|nr:hypothetical protein [Gammaproteobacteria bacterium]